MRAGSSVILESCRWCRNRKVCRIISFLLIAVLVSGSVWAADVARAEAEEVTSEDSISNDDIEDLYDVRLTYDVISSWKDHYNVEITLTNILDEKIDDWEIKLPAADLVIEDIENAKVVRNENGEYTIHNAEWNQDIPAGKKVSFRMTVKGSGKLKFPEFCEMTRLCLGIRTPYDVEYSEDSRRGDRIKGQITITNQGDDTIEDWTLMLDANFEIEKIWNAKLLEKYEEEGLYYYDIENVADNQNIAPQQSVTFKFTAKCDGAVKITANDLFGMIEYTDEVRDEYMDIDLGDVEDYDDDECIFDADYFETAEEYEAYMNSLQLKPFTRTIEIASYSVFLVLTMRQMLPCEN